MKAAEKAVASDNNKLLINKVFFCYNDLEFTATLNCYLLLHKVRKLNYCTLAKG